MLHFLNYIANDAESTQKIKNYVIIASLKRETMGKLINRLPGSRLLISNLPGSALRTQALRCQQVLSKPCLVNLISKDTHLVFSIFYFCRPYQLKQYKVIKDDIDSTYGKNRILKHYP